MKNLSSFTYKTDFLKDYKIYLNTTFKATTVMKLKKKDHLIILEDNVFSHV